MVQTTINPYPVIGKDFTNGLNAIIAGLPPTPTTNDLANLIVTYIDATYYGTSLTGPQLIELKSIVLSAADSYTNGGISNMYAGSRNPLALLLMGPSFANYTLDSLKSRILDIEDNIPKSGLGIAQQAPYYFATVIGTFGYDYWTSEIASGTSLWKTPYFDNALSSALSNASFWIAAGMQ